ncbi:MAG: hypothetical protein WD942_10030 [Dehalococcoidia bacterium]
MEETHAKFLEAGSFCDSKGVLIRNATVGGTLEEIPRVSLDEVLGITTDEKCDISRHLVESKIPLSRA